MLSGPPWVATVTPHINLLTPSPGDLHIFTSASILLPMNATIHCSAMNGSQRITQVPVCFGKCFIYVVCARQVSKLSLTLDILTAPGRLERQSCQKSPW